MSDALELASDLLKISRQLNRDRFSEELETYCWPLVELIEWDDPIDVCTFNAALYYGETLQEQTPAHLLSGSVYNEWVAAIKADRFPAYRAQEHAINQRAQAVLRSPLMGEIDLSVVHLGRRIQQIWKGQRPLQVLPFVQRLGEKAFVGRTKPHHGQVCGASLQNTIAQPQHVLVFPECQGLRPFKSNAFGPVNP